MKTRSDWSDVNELTRRVWIVREGIWTNVVPLKPRDYAKLIDALGEIAKTARWYADNGQRLPHEVDHALCVEILSLAEEALS